jgi:hypothetical protein
MPIKHLRFVLAAFFIGLTAGALVVPVPVHAATYVVNTTDQRIDFGTNPCTVDHCSLWEAAITATMHPGYDRITFDLPGDPPYIIYLGDPVHLGLTYQEINLWDDDTDIDATTQPGWPIYLHGLGEAGWGMIVHSDQNTIRGLGFLGFNEAGIAVVGNENFLDRLVVGDYLGEGLIPAPIDVHTGIHLSGDDNTVRGASIANARTGILVDGSNETIEDSHIGFIFGSSSLRGNRDGIRLNGSGNTIQRNVILGNSENGIWALSDGNTIIRNRIGLD